MVNKILLFENNRALHVPARHASATLRYSLTLPSDSIWKAFSVNP